jgi:hypothetical protein
VSDVLSICITFSLGQDGVKPFFNPINHSDVFVILEHANRVQ